MALMVQIIPTEVSQQKLLPIIIEMHNDDNVDVRIGIIKTMGTYIKWIGKESVPVLYTYLKSLFSDPKWRVRNQALETIVDIGSHFQVPFLL